MKYSALLFAVLMFALPSCGEDDHTVPGIEIPEDPEQDIPVEAGLYDWEEARDGILDYTDMVLLYGGGAQRYIPNWDADRLSAYVTYTDQKNVEKWFFDSFLFLEFADYGSGSANVTFATGYKNPNTGKLLDSATKKDWGKLAEYYFLENHNLDQLDATVANAARRIGRPAVKPRVIITIPEPIMHKNCGDNNSSTVYWGELDGKQLDFSKTADRVEACCWYIDRVRALFNKRDYQNIELAGFYWIAERSTESTKILSSISEYLHERNYSFNWIPYFNADGYGQWKVWGFDYAYLQPNYFFNDATPISRLTEACSMASSAKMGMEMEFDDNALASNGRAYKLRNYMEAFRNAGIWDNSRLAYYQGNNTVYTLKMSSNAEDQELYHEFAAFVTTRPIRKI